MLSQLLGIKKAAYLPAGRLRHTPSLELWLEYTLILRPLMTAKNHLSPISLTVLNLTPKIYSWQPPGTTCIFDPFKMRWNVLSIGEYSDPAWVRNFFPTLDMSEKWSIPILWRDFKDTCYTWCQISSKFVNTQCIKNPRGVFWQPVQRWEKWSQSWKARPGGRAKIENVTWCIIYIFNFSSAIRGHFSNVSTLFTSMDALSKKRPSDFWKTV